MTIFAKQFSSRNIFHYEFSVVELGKLSISEYICVCEKNYNLIFHNAFCDLTSFWFFEFFPTSTLFRTFNWKRNDREFWIYTLRIHSFIFPRQTSTSLLIFLPFVAFPICPGAFPHLRFRVGKCAASLRATLSLPAKVLFFNVKIK